MCITDSIPTISHLFNNSLTFLTLARQRTMSQRNEVRQHGDPTVGAFEPSVEIKSRLAPRAYLLLIANESRASKDVGASEPI